MQDLKNILEASLLGDVETTIANADVDMDAYMASEIEKKLTNENDYYIHSIFKNALPYEIIKVRGKWVVNVFGDLTIYSNHRTAVTDGSFSFGRVNGTVNIALSDDDTEFQSLQYGPKEVCDHFNIYGGLGIKDLKYCPNVIIGDLNVANLCGLKSLKYMPKSVGRNCCIVQCKKLEDFLKIGKCRVGNIVKIFNNGTKVDALLASKINDKWDIRHFNDSKFDYNR